MLHICTVPTPPLAKALHYAHVSGSNTVAPHAPPNNWQTTQYVAVAGRQAHLTYNQQHTGTAVALLLPICPLSPVHTPTHSQDTLLTHTLFESRNPETRGRG